MRTIMYILSTLIGILLSSIAWNLSAAEPSTPYFSGQVLYLEQEIEQLRREVAELKESKENDKSSISGYDHGFFVKSHNGDYLFKLRFFGQVYYEFDRNEDAADVNTFGLRRARLLLSGNVFNPNLTYMIMPEMVSQYSVVTGTTAYSIVDSAGNTALFNVTDTSDRNFRLLYLWAQYRLCDEFQIRIGEFTPPTEFFFRASHLLEFEDFPLIAVAEPFTPTFQTGIDLLGTIAKKLDYELFAVNGSNLDRVNLNKAFRIGAMLTWNVLGKPGLGVADVDYSESPQLALTLSGTYEHPDAPQGAPININTGDNVVRGQFNGVFRWKGFAIVPEAILFYDNRQHLKHWAFAGQTGYFIIPRVFELAMQANYLRYSGSNNDRYEFSGGFNYYFYGQPIKLQMDYSLLDNKRPGDDQISHRIRLGTQIGFF